MEIETMKRSLLLLAILLLPTLILGCGVKKHSDLPKLYSCKIKIVDKSGAPVENVTVVATRPESKWAGIGLTDTTGIAILKTNGIYLGVPAGTYKIVATKYDVKTIKRDGEVVNIIETAVLDKSFADESTTPLQLTVETKPNNETFTIF